MSKGADDKKQILSTILVTLALLTSILAGTVLVYRKTDQKGPRIFGATYMTMNNPYFTSLNESIREAVEARGDILMTRDPAQNQDRQNEQIREMIREGMTVLFLNPVDWDKVQPALLECREAEVAVFVVDTSVRDSSKVVSVIQSDQYLAGRLIARDMKEMFPDGARIITMYHYNIHSAVQRLKGFQSEIEGDDRYEVVGSTSKTSEIETANEEMNRMLRVYHNIDVVFGANDPTAIGALASIQSYLEEHPKYGSDIHVYGVDGSPDAKLLISRGEMAGTAAQYPEEMGRKAAQAAYDYLDGKYVRKNYTIRVSLLNKQNIDPGNLNSWQ